MDLDEIDVQILEVLQREGRISNQDLAERVGLSPSPCLRRLKQLESSGVIQRYVALIDPVAAGQPLQAIIEVRLDHQTSAAVDRFEKEIVKYPQVLECYLMAGDWDYMLRVQFHDLDEFREFCIGALSKIPGVANVKSNVCMKCVKFTTVLPIDRGV